MKNIIIGTAGHVDHGKTTLIKMLTGINTDRLQEEQERGMTIDIGFAYLTLPNGQKVSIIDVPGHERFIKNMLAGAGGVDAALLVIAADESVMPQTIEHMDILSLLEIKRGVIALTKADMVDEEWLALAKQDVRKAMSKTFLADAPIISVSGTTGIGCQELLYALQDMVSEIEQRESFGDFRLPIDRVFTLTGFGTVVTGTLASGTMTTGDAVDIMPKGLKSRIRQLQVHGKKVESVQAGARAAVNLAGLEVDDLSRGDVCASPGSLQPSQLFDLKLNLLPDASKPLRNRTRIRFYVGTSELLGRIVLLDRDKLSPGDTCYAQFVSETMAVCAKKDRFVIRSYSPMTTIGGGVVIDSNPKKHKKLNDELLASLDAADRGTPKELMEEKIKSSVFAAVQSLIKDNADVDDARQIIESLIDEGRVIKLGDDYVVHISVYTGCKARIMDFVSKFHEKNPLKAGIPPEQIRSSVMKQLDNRQFNLILNQLLQNDDIRSFGNLVSEKEFSPIFTPKQKQFTDDLTKILMESGINVPSISDIIGKTEIPPNEAKEIVELLSVRNEITKINDDIYLHSRVVERLKTVILNHLESNESITVSQFRDITNSSRKYALPILEYFDSIRFTRRVGDKRKLII